MVASYDDWEVYVAPSRGAKAADFGAIVAELKNAGDTLYLPANGKGWSNRPVKTLDKVLAAAEAAGIPVKYEWLGPKNSRFSLRVVRLVASK